MLHPVNLLKAAQKRHEDYIHLISLGRSCRYSPPFMSELRVSSTHWHDQLVALAAQSGSSGRAIAGRSVSLRILCDQLEHTRANLARLDIDTLATPDE